MSNNPRPPHLILASGSPRRQELLTRLGLAFDVHPGTVIEREPRPAEDPAEYALELAQSKACYGLQRHPEGVVLGADTVVTIDGIILGKPRDEDQARDMLLRLRGRCHSVVTAVAVGYRGDLRRESLSTQVCMRPFTDDELSSYLVTGESMDKAGAYALQGFGARLIARAIGCHNNVVGLPLCVAARLLTDHGVAVVIPERADIHAS